MRAALLEGAPLGTVAPELLVLAVMGVDLSEWVVVWGGPPYTVGQAATLLELGILVASRAPAGRRDAAPLQIHSEGRLPMDASERDSLLRLADEVAELNGRRRALAKELARLRDEAAEIRAQHVLDVAQQRDATGKAAYTNAEAREAMVILQLKADSGYQQLEQRRRALQDEYDRVAVEYARQRDRQDVLMAAAGIARAPVVDAYGPAVAPLVPPAG